MTHFGGDLQNNLRTLSGQSSEMSMNTWWFMFFAWSLKSSVPFSGYVNTERDHKKEEIYESSHHIWETRLKDVALFTPCTTVSIQFLPAFLILSDPARVSCSICCPLRPWQGPHHTLCTATPSSTPPGQHTSSCIAWSHLAEPFSGAETMSFIFVKCIQSFVKGMVA